MISPLLPPILVGALTFAAMLAALVGWFIVLSPGVIAKLVPWRPVQRAASAYCVWGAGQWVATNQLLLRLIHALQWQVDFRTLPRRHANYLLLCNHQSWADILVLFDVLHGRVPFPRFFMKQALRYMPIIGQICWAMDFPFMKRHSRAAIAANPALRLEDLETTRRACEIFRTLPVTVVNFAEGTRFTEAKRLASGSPFRHLLRPNAGGLSFTLNSMGEQFAGVLDVTLAYQPTRAPLLWSWLIGEQDLLGVHVDVLPIPAELVGGDYEGDPEFRARFQAWLNGIWARKDARLERLLARPVMPPAQRPVAM